MSFRFPVKLFFEDFREKVIEEKANQERIKIEKINQDDVYDFISNFLNEDDTRNKLPNYLSKIKDVSNERIKRALGKRSDGSVPLVYMDLVTIYFTKNFNTSFLIHFNIDTTTKLRKFVQKNEIQNFQEIKINSDILNMYDKESLKILPNTIIDKVNAIEIDHSVEEITNKWRFWFPNGSSNVYSQKILHELSNRLNLNKGSKLENHTDCFCEKLDDFILDCIIDEEKLKDKKLQEHIEQKLLFPDELSVLQLFNLGKIKNVDPRKNRGIDLLSLDVLACFIAGKPTTLQKYLDLEKASDLEQFLTEHHKTDSNEFKKRNLEGRNFDKICEEGFWYEDRRAIENLKSKKGDIKKSKWVIYIPIPILIFIITSILCWNNLSLAERKEGLDMSIVILPFDKSNDSNLTMEKFIKNELNKFYNNSLNPTGATLEITIEKSVNLSKYDYSLECDPGIIQKIGKDLNADIVIWGDYAYIENKGEYSSKVYSLIIDGIDSQIPKKVSNIISMLNKKQLESLRERKSPPISIHNRDKNQVQDLHIVVECIIAFQYLKEGNWKKAFDVFKKKYYLEAYMFIMKEILKKSTSALEYADKYYSDKGDGKYHTYVCLMLGESYFYHSSTKENAIDEVKIKNKLFLDKSKFYLEIFFRLSKQRRISLEMSNKLDEKYQEALRMENEALLNYIKNMYVQGVSTEGIIKVINNHILELKRIQELRIDTNLYEYLDSYINIILPEEKAHFYTLKGAFNRAMNEIFDILDYCGVNYENLIFNAFLQKEFDLKQINYSNIRTILEECESFNEGIFNRENSEYISIGKILILIGFIHEIRFDELEYLNIKYYDIKPSKDLKREKVQVLTLYFIEYVRSSYHVKENLKLFEKIEIKRINKLKTISVNQYLTDSHNKLHNERILSIQKME